uniref:Ribonuclease H-like domain-containing protein n=1 Tax=Parastrongyloides trichosuri TaxID=131310 RepID=A0A0N4ZDB0_PARTI
MKIKSSMKLFLDLVRDPPPDYLCGKPNASNLVYSKYGIFKYIPLESAFDHNWRVFFGDYMGCTLESVLLLYKHDDALAADTKQKEYLEATCTVTYVGLQKKNYDGSKVTPLVGYKDTIRLKEPSSKTNFSIYGLYQCITIDRTHKDSWLDYAKDPFDYFAILPKNNSVVSEDELKEKGKCAVDKDGFGKLKLVVVHMNNKKSKFNTQVSTSQSEESTDVSDRDNIRNLIGTKEIVHPSAK